MQEGRVQPGNLVIMSGLAVGLAWRTRWYCP
jgi:hypothetical protein